MSAILRRAFFSSILALAFSWDVFFRYDGEYGSEQNPTGKQQYRPHIPTIILPIFFVILWAIGLIFRDVPWTIRATLSMCFSIFLHISLYYLILMPLLPLLRKVISARACAMLWLIPNYLYITSYTFMELPAPALVITAPGNLVWTLMGIWFVGFVGVLAWKLIDHLRFRRMVLKRAELHPDVNCRSRLRTVLEEVHYPHPDIPLYVSPAVTTPLTIGLFKSTTVVVLPKKEYTLEELLMIFWHEVIHICREDAWNKFFLMFCTAICWFNPMMWRAMKKSAEDLELSCDETVLLDLDEDARKRYARLILNTAGDHRGFTTCLSASAEALRYRLKRITGTRVVRSGATIVGMTFLLLSLTSGYVALAYNGQSGGAILFRSENPGDYSLTAFYPGPHDSDIAYHVNDMDALYDYISGLTLYELTGNYTFEDSDRFMNMYFTSPSGRINYYLRDDGIQVHDYQNPRELSYYHVPDGIDWEYLDSLVIEIPTLQVWLTRPYFDKGHMIDATMTGYWRLENGERFLLREAAAPEHGLQGFRATEATLMFNQTPVGPCTVLVYNADHSECYTVTLDPEDGALTMALAEYSAFYTVTAQFRDNAGNLYEGEFQFLHFE